MEIDAVTEQIRRIKVRLPNSPLKNLNSYIITGGTRNLLIDTGFHLDESFADLKEGLRELDIDMARTDIFLTHCHADHAGNAGRIASDPRSIFSGSVDKIIIEKMVLNMDLLVKQFDEKMIRDGFPEEERRRSLKVNPAVNYSEKTRFTPAGIDEGHIFDLGGLSLKAIHTPGHTPGHMCLLIEEEKILFTGDHVLFDITPNITDWPGLDDSLGSYMDSLRRVRKMDIKLALPGHRESGDIYTRIDELLKHHVSRLKEAYDIAAGNGKKSSYDVASKMNWKITRKDWNDFPPSQKFFAVGEARSHLDHLKKLGKIKIQTEGEVDYFTAVKGSAAGGFL